MVLARRRMTLDEFLQLPEEKPALEFIDGRVAQKPMPDASHSRLQFVLAYAIERAAPTGRRVYAFPELRGIYGPNALVPDVAAYEASRVTRSCDGGPADIMEQLPDLAIEVRSRGQTRANQMERCRRLLALGAPIVLAVDRFERTVTRLDPTGERVFRNHERIDLAPFLPDFDLSSEALFAGLLDPEPPG